MSSKSLYLYGAVAGDIIGSGYEFDNIFTKDFELYERHSFPTDDSVLTIATADAIILNPDEPDFKAAYLKWGRAYPDADYGAYFYHKWLLADDPQPYCSFGNGSAMRVSAVGFAYNSWDEVWHQAEKSAEVTHNHPEGIKGAQATAAAIYLARTGSSKDEIKAKIEETCGYDLSRTVDEIRDSGYADLEEAWFCQGTVPEAIISFLESDSYEDALRNCISLGGDSDTIAAVTGPIALAYYKTIPEEILVGIEPATIAEGLEGLLPVCRNFQDFCDSRIAG